MSSKENRYRLLLELYPADFRREYTDEMIGVLMADPSPVRKHAASLLAGAVTARLRSTLEGPEWRRAAFTVQLFGAILLCAVALRRFAMVGAVALFEPAYNRPPFAPFDVARAVPWAVVVVATLAGWRGLSVTAALAGVIAEIAAPSRFYTDSPVMLLNVFWIVMSAAVVLIASTVSVHGPRPRGSLFVVAAGVVLATNGFSTRIAYPDYLGTLSLDGNQSRFAFTLFLLLTTGGLALVGVFRLDPAVRRRVIACTVPVAAVFPLVSYGFGGFLEFNSRHPDDIQLLGPVQWAALIVVPAAAFWTAAGLNQRLERSRAMTVVGSGGPAGSGGLAASGGPAENGGSIGGSGATVPGDSRPET
jgi:hypothetical protein